MAANINKHFFNVNKQNVECKQTFFSSAIFLYEKFMKKFIHKPIIVFVLRYMKNVYSYIQSVDMVFLALI